jgi:hypothetical protein
MYEMLLMQIPEAATLTQLITAVGTLVGTIGAIVTPLFLILRSKINKANTQAHEAIDIGIKVGQYATTFGQKTAEQEQKIKTLTEVATTLSPDFKNLLGENKGSIEKYTRDVIIAYEQLKRLEAELPETAKANNIKDLPR